MATINYNGMKLEEFTSDKTADLLQARDYAESLNEDFDDPDGAHYTVGMIKENG